MDIWFAALLGVVQGLTEFLPISSTAHLRITPELLGQADPGAAFSAVIQLGTLLAVLIYFARDLFIDIPRAVLYERHTPLARMPIYLALGTLPIVVLGLTLKDFIVGDARSLYVVASALIAVGVLMYFVDRRARGLRTLASVTLSDALLIGAAQSFALIPGVSRSGSTIVAALMLGLARPDAARFSFLLGIPAIAGAGIYELRDVLASLGEGAWVPVAVGTATSAISGYISIAWLLRYLQRKSLAPFALYRVAIGIALIVLCIAGVLTPGAAP
ncbi:undecaprenyl-diphosphatase UppP [Haliangium ochraceum]|uniref:Undecaprenyl-diphosphatase n=1 Tax=Haliangium ochraceum (strain DSM 14365 / JCM 11303 / SMP-2) TaxID=502025 RepID=D0LX56_HALO1|nr:undecaprenyl-diphosphatase UppP [Haliangium ochraceum]ACY16098.1 undecaprenol kinase [Haliangium ochraceum DSM 14365]